MPVQAEDDAIEFATRLCQAHALAIEAASTTDRARRADLLAAANHHAARATALFAPVPLRAAVQIDCILHHFTHQPGITDPTQALALAGLAMAAEATP